MRSFEDEMRLGGWRRGLVVERGPDALSLWAARAVAHVVALSVGGPLMRRHRVTLNFHPDRVTKGASVLEHLSREGVYRSQFETGSSNGGLTAYPGGDRWRWERQIFGRAYDDAPVEERPKYGAMNYRRRGIGGAPRFGSAHLRLAEGVLERTTFCFPDSVLGPHDFGSSARFDLIPFADEFARIPRSDADERMGPGVLDDYIEAHVHGVVRIDQDVEALVLDPCFRDTVTEEQALALPVDVEWHEGRRLTVPELEHHPDYRGPNIVALGRTIARDGILDAFVISEAAREDSHDPQDLKKVWHLVARFGAPTHSP